MQEMVKGLQEEGWKRKKKEEEGRREEGGGRREEEEEEKKERERENTGTKGKNGNDKYLSIITLM